MYTYIHDTICFEKSPINLSFNQLENRNDLFNDSSTNLLSNYSYSSLNNQSSNLSPNNQYSNSSSNYQYSNSSSNYQSLNLSPNSNSNSNELKNELIYEINLTDKTLDNQFLTNDTNKIEKSNKIDINFEDESIKKLPSIDSLLNHDQSNNERLNNFLDKNQQVINQSNDSNIYQDNIIKDNCVSPSTILTNEILQSNLTTIKLNSTKRPVDSKFYYDKCKLSNSLSDINNLNQLIINERTSKSFSDITFLHDNYQISSLNNFDNQSSTIYENQFKINNIDSTFKQELSNDPIKLMKINQFKENQINKFNDNQIKSQIISQSDISNNQLNNINYIDNQFNSSTFNASYCSFTENQIKSDRFNDIQLDQFNEIKNDPLNYSKIINNEFYPSNDIIDICGFRDNNNNKRFKNDLNKQFTYHNYTNDKCTFNLDNSHLINDNQNINLNNYPNQSNEFKYSNQQYQLDKLYNLNNQVNNLKEHQFINQQINQLNIPNDQNNQLNTIYLNNQKELSIDKKKDYAVNPLKRKINDKLNLIKNKKQNLKKTNQLKSLSNSLNSKINRELIKKKINSRIKCTRNKNLSFEEQEIKRDKANSQERNRMHKINLALNELKRKMQSILSDDTNDFNFNLSKIKQLFDLKLDCNYESELDNSNDFYNQISYDQNNCSNNYHNIDQFESQLDQQQQNLINNSFDLVNNSSNNSIKNFKPKKLSKIATLKLAIGYIFYLSKKLNII